MKIVIFRSDGMDPPFPQTPHLPNVPPVYFRRVKDRGGRGFPWLVILLLLASIYVFWILPKQFPSGAVEIEFVPDKSGAKTPSNAPQK